MLSVVLIWLYMMGVTFLLGYGILTGLTCLFPYRIRNRDSYFVCGLAAAAVYAQYVSIFAPVGLTANMVLTGICLSIAFLCRKRLKKDIQGVFAVNGTVAGSASGGAGTHRRAATRRAVFLVILFLLYAYGTSRGIIHYDTGLYHAQSIRWLEEYGLVKGLGNLHCRLAYNSASFALSALFSMAFLGGRSYHCAAGFLALLVASVCFDFGKTIRRKQLRPSDFAKVMGIYYLLIIYDEMISPASDYFMVLTVFYLVIRWMELLEEKETAVFPYAMLCVLAVFVLTVKLSGALIVLLAIGPAVWLVQRKRWQEILCYLALGTVTLLPYLIRNVLLSGWLVYPFTGIDLFGVDWKIPEGLAACDAKEIQVWGRGYTDVTQYDMPPWKWLPSWFEQIVGLDKLFVLAAFAAVAALFVRTAWRMATAKRRKMDDSTFLGMPLLQWVLALSFLFWLFSSPLIRYGCVYVYLTFCVIGGELLLKRRMERICVCMMGLFLAYKAAAFGRELAVFYVNDYWIFQKDYDSFETESYEIEGVTFYYPVTGDRAGYESFPSAPAKAQIAFRGEGIADGFRAE